MDVERQSTDAEYDAQHDAEYDDPALDYRDYWLRRDYEDQSERLAIRRLLAGRSFAHALEIGGGYGRLSALLAEHADLVTLTDASRRQLRFAAEHLAGYSRVEYRVMDAEALDVDAASVDLVVIIRVLHHLPDPSRVFAEVGRVLAPGGVALIEVANQAHAMNRLRYCLRGRRVPRDPVDLRSAANRERGSIPFVNHHPAAVAEGLKQVGLTVERRLSVSNLRSSVVKKVVPARIMVGVERRLQGLLGPVAFGPSLMLLARKEPDLTERP
ncbi:MAG: class I SAM-dependent methyltransferase [Catenulispora sp.]